jgi:hypothetical protein
LKSACSVWFTKAPQLVLFEIDKEKHIVKTLKTLSLALTLTGFLAVSAMAGETSSPPCQQPDPGEVNSPPCVVGAQVPEDLNITGQPTTPSDSATVADYLATETAVDFLQSVLALF